MCMYTCTQGNSHPETQTQTALYENNPTFSLNIILQKNKLQDIIKLIPGVYVVACI